MRFAGILNAFYFNLTSTKISTSIVSAKITETAGVISGIIIILMNVCLL
jgi:hypothetical protein